MESSVFGAEFVEMKNDIATCRGLCYKLIMMGVALSAPTFVYGDNMSVVQFNVILFNCAFTKLIVPKAGNITLATMPARESWLMAPLSHSCSQSVGLIAVTVTTISVVFCIVHI
jgi:hypothetical protein